MPELAYVAGVDGGGTKTETLIAAPDGTILGRALAPSSNYQKVGFASAVSAIRQSLAEAAQLAGAGATPPLALCLGLAGVDRVEDQRLWEEWAAQEYPQTPCTVVNDAELPLAAGTPEGWGVGVICGTGATCVGRNRGGDFARADGWGYLLGDNGSGYAIGRAAMQAVMRAYDGRGPTTLLTSGVMEFWSLDHPEALLDKVYIQGATPTEIAALAVVVSRCAEEGDATAMALLRDAGSEIACTIGAVVRALALEGPIPCALAGGVITKSSLMAGFTAEAARAAGLTLDPVTLVTQPALGALRLALRLLNGDAKAEIR